MGITHTHNSTYRSELPGEGNVQWRASFEYLPKIRGNDHLVFHGRMFRPGKDFYLTRKHAAVKVSKLKEMSADDWDFYVNCTEEAKKYTKAFRDIIKFHKLKIQIAFVRPCVAPIDAVSKVTRKFLAKKYKKKFRSGEYVIIERFLEGKFQDFISVIGEVLQRRIGILEAFSHFTYWQSSGDLIVCGLKGLRSTVDRGVDGEWKVLEMTSPCIHSIDNEFGPDDLGEEGMKMFFQHHKCNEICSSWANFETLNSQRVRNSSFVPVDADAEESETYTKVYESEPYSKAHVEKERSSLVPVDTDESDTYANAYVEKELHKGSPKKEKESLLMSAVEPPEYKEIELYSTPSKIGYIPPKPYPENFLSIHPDENENDSGIDTSPNASTPDGSIESLPSFSEIINPETDQRSYIKFPVARPVKCAPEVTIPKSLSLDCEKAMMDGHTIVFQRDGDRTMKPIIKNGYPRHNDIEIQIETDPTLDDLKKNKRVSWNPNVGSH